MVVVSPALNIAVAALVNVLVLISSRDSRLGRRSRRRLRLSDMDESAVGKH